VRLLADKLEGEDRRAKSRTVFDNCQLPRAVGERDMLEAAAAGTLDAVRPRPALAGVRKEVLAVDFPSSSGFQACLQSPGRLRAGHPQKFTRRT